MNEALHRDHSIEYYKKAAKRLLREFRASDHNAAARLRLSAADGQSSLMYAQHVVAKENGCGSWKELIDRCNASRKG